MTEQELKDRIKVEWKGYGSYRITIKFRNKFYSCISHNSLAYDDMDSYDNHSSYYTSKQAYQALYDECKRANNL